LALGTPVKIKLLIVNIEPGRFWYRENVYLYLNFQQAQLPIYKD